MNTQTIADMEIAGKRVLIRADLNGLSIAASARNTRK
jgi:3-phosphoglycerate kinase